MGKKGIAGKKYEHLLLVLVSIAQLFVVTTVILPQAKAAPLPTPAIWIDPNNSSSYPGTGTTVTSIGSMSNTGTLTNGVTFSANSGAGYFSLNGTNQYIKFPASNFNFGNAFTLSGWVMSSGTTNIQTFIANGVAGSAANGFKTYWNSWDTSDKNMLMETGNGTANATGVTTGGPVTTSTWQYLTYVVNKTAGTVTFYDNGQLVSASSTTIRTDMNTTGAWNLGAFTDPSYYATAKFGVFKVFLSALSATDVGSDFSSTAARYGATPLVATPSITTNPSSASISSGSTATFTAAATTTDAGSISYQWQQSTDGITWSNVTTGTGGTSATYTTGVLTSSNSGTQYRCMAINTLNNFYATANSATATVTVSIIKTTPSIATSLTIGTTNLTTFRGITYITLTSSVPGTISVYANGKLVFGCKNIPITSSAVCAYKSISHGMISLYAVLTPTDTIDYNSSVTSSYTFMSGPRVGSHS
jgi:hypothetical protein